MSVLKDSARVGVIGGSGFYELLENAREVRIQTPFGDPSDVYFLGEIEGVPVAFLPRHARGHRILPSEVNYRANVWGMKALGVRYILSASAVGTRRSSSIASVAHIRAAAALKAICPNSGSFIRQ